MPKPMPVRTVNSGCAKGDITTRTKKVAAVTEASAAVAVELVGAEGGAEVEDVLGEREAGGGDPGDDDPVDDPGEVPSAEQEDQQDGRRLRGLLHDGRYDGRAEGVGVGRVGRSWSLSSCVAKLLATIAMSAAAHAPQAKAKSRFRQGPGCDAVQPAERGDEQRDGQHGEAEADQEALGAGLLADQGQDHQAGDREQGDQRAVRAPTFSATSAHAAACRHRRAGPVGCVGYGGLGGHGIDPNEGGALPATVRGAGGVRCRLRGSVADGLLVPVLYAPEQQVVHHMALVQSLALETGQRAGTSGRGA